MRKRAPTKNSVYKIGTYTLNQKFQGYRAREDKTIVGPATLVAPSRNVMTNPAGRVATVQGYSLDGPASAIIDSGILSSFDFVNFKGDVRNVRAGFLTSAGGNGKLQYRFSTGLGTLASPLVVTWIDLQTAMSSVRLSFTGDFWDTAALVKRLLWVDGSNNIYSWNGAVTTFASATVNTVTKQGTTTWAQEGFTQTGTRSIVINGVTATYTGGENTTILTGVSVDFSASTVGTTIHQSVVTTTLSSMTGILATFAPTVIGCGRRNQVYLGSSTSNNLYISNVNSFTNYSFTSPTRVVGEGALIPLDAPPTKFIPMEMRTDTNAYDLYISEGLSTWAVIRATLSNDLTKETLEHIRMKVAPLQGAFSEKFATKMKNHIMFVGNDKVANFFGFLSYQFLPSVTDFSYPIIDDMNSYDLTDGSIFYYKNYVLLSIPKSGIVRIYNMTDQTEQENSSFKGVEDVTKQPWYWEAPIGYPISNFYVVNGELYGHSYTTSESYKLFTTGSFNGQDIDANATFGYDDKGDRTESKASTELWVEGYIKQNTKLECTIVGDLDAFMTSQTVVVDGSNSAQVAYGSGGGSIGKNSLGSNPLGGSSTVGVSLPAWFHVAKTYPAVASYLEQISFATKGVDLEWQLVCYGTNSLITNEGNNSIND